MKRLLVAAGLIVMLARSPRADACGVYPLGEVLAHVAESLDGDVKPITVPVLVLGTGASSDGKDVTVTAGVGWGTRQEGGLFPGSSLRRVLAGVRRTGDDTTFTLTYGWYNNEILDLAFDVGAMTSRGPTGSLEMSGTGYLGTGPLAQAQVGLGGFAVRLTGGMEFGADHPRGYGAAELVVDVTRLAKQI